MSVGYRKKAVCDGYRAEILRQRDAWDRKDILRTIYTRYFRAMGSHLVPGGLTIEIGGGSGRLKEHLRSCNIVCSDVLSTPWIDCQLDAQALPFLCSSVRNVVGIDVVHHLSDPLQFFREAFRVLDDGGRIVLLEPHLSLWGFAIYKFLHHESCNLGDDPWGPRPAVADHNLANAALPWLCTQRYRRKFEKDFPGLSLVHVEYMDFIAYPASGGFTYPKMLPNAPIFLMLKLEEWVPQQVRKYLTGIRYLMVLEKKNVVQTA